MEALIQKSTISRLPRDAPCWTEELDNIVKKKNGFHKKLLTPIKDSEKEDYMCIRRIVQAEFKTIRTLRKNMHNCAGNI